MQTGHDELATRPSSASRGTDAHTLATPRAILAGLLGLGWLLLANAPTGVVWAADVPTVAAASDLQFALREVAALFTQRNGKQVKLTFGSSGNFRRQITRGAPYEMYMSADEAYVQALHEEGLTRDQGTLYALGRIVVIVPAGSPLEPDPELAGLRAALHDGRLHRFAIANPEHAPYGRAAREALVHTGLWADIQARLTLGENVSQATRFALSGATQGGIVAYSLALAPNVAARSRYALIPTRLHTPLRQRMVLLKGAGATALAFYEFVQQSQAREIFRCYGFTLPGSARKTHTKAQRD